MAGKAIDCSTVAWAPHAVYSGVFVQALVDRGTNPLGTFNRVRIVPGAEIKPHVHAASAETFLMTAGRALATLGDTAVEFRAGHLGYAPAGTLHGVKNIGEDDVYLVTTFTPPA